MPQLYDVFGNADSISEAAIEVKFQHYLKKISEAPSDIKKILAEQIYARDFSFSDLERIFNCEREFDGRPNIL